MKKTIYLFPLLLIVFYYSLFYTIFIKKVDKEGEDKTLRARFGTIMWHSSDTHEPTKAYLRKPVVYCYYPTSAADYNNKGGEFIIKKVDSLKDCDQWLGRVIFEEEEWVSEREKIWWEQDSI